MTELYDGPEEDKQRLRDAIMARTDLTDDQKRRAIEAFLNPSPRIRNLDASVKQVENVIFKEMLERLPFIRELNGLDASDTNLVMYRVYLSLAAHSLDAAYLEKRQAAGVESFAGKLNSQLQIAGAEFFGRLGLV